MGTQSLGDFNLIVCAAVDACRLSNNRAKNFFMSGVWLFVKGIYYSPLIPNSCD